MSGLRHGTGPDVHGEIAKAIVQTVDGDTLEWDFATEADRDQMRVVAAEVEPILRRTADRLARWLEECSDV